MKTPEILRLFIFGMIASCLAACSPATLPETSLPRAPSSIPATDKTTQIISLPTVTSVPAPTSTPTFAPADTPTPTSSPGSAPTQLLGSLLPALVDCAGAPPSRMTVGADVFINMQLTLPLRLRDAPGLSARILERNLRGAQMVVTGGPQCADGYTWWQIKEKESGATGWSAEGTYDEMYLIPSGLIAYRDQYTLPTDPYLRQLSVINLLTPSGAVLYQPVNGFIGAWDISQDSKNIAYTLASTSDFGKTGLYIAPAAETVPEEHLLGAPKARRISLDGPSWISWSPDNKRLLYIDSFFNVKVISVTGGEPLLLTRLEKLDYISLAWAPDSANVALIGEQLMVFDAFTGKKRILTDTPNHMLTWMYNDIQYVSWSPDGKRLLFSKNYGLSMIAMDGTGERKIVTGSAAEPLSWGRWSPDGTMISYLRSGRSSTSKVMLQKLGGNVGNEVARDVLVTSGVIWSANGNYLIFVNNGTQVTILNLANQVKYELTGLKGSGYSVIETRWRNGLP